MCMSIFLKLSDEFVGSLSLVKEPLSPPSFFAGILVGKLLLLHFGFYIRVKGTHATSPV